MESSSDASINETDKTTQPENAKEATAPSVSESTDVPAPSADAASTTTSEQSTENDSDTTSDDSTENNPNNGLNDGPSAGSEGGDVETMPLPKSGPKIGLFSESSAGFFGITVQAEKIAYVIDVSSSMGGWMLDANTMKLDRLKQELLQSIERLNKSQRFTVVMFNDQAIFDNRFELAKPTRKLADELKQWLSITYPAGGTDPEQAMLSTLRGEYDAIFLLSDGEFNPATLAVIKQANTNRVLINTICLGVDAQTLQFIAKESGGQYRSIQ